MARARVHDFHEDEVLGKAYDWPLLKRLGRYLIPYKRVVYLSIALALGLSVTEAVGPLIIGWIIDGPIQGGSTGGLALWSMIYLAVIAVGLVLEYASFYLIQWTGQMGMRDIRHEIFAKFQRLHLQHFDKNPVGRLLTRVTSDVSVLNELFAAGVVALIKDALLIVIVTVWMLWLSWRLTLVIYLAVPVIFLISWVFRMRVREAYRTMRARLSRLNAFIQESVQGMRTVQVFNREPLSMDQFHELNTALCDAHRATITNYAWFFPAIEFVTNLSLAGLIVAGAVLATGETVSIGVLVTFVIWLQRFFRPIQDLSERYNVLQSAITSSERIFKLLDTPEEIPNPREPRPLRLERTIEFRDVWFAYHDEEWILRDVSFTVERGQTAALVGATGAGKTTVASLLLRLYDIQRGQILIDGVDIREFDKHALRRLFGVVPQDLFLFHGDVAGNIRLGHDDVSDEEIRRICEYVNAWGFISAREGGLHAPVAERGAGFSVGQKQLMAFARALAFDPQVLILDEATSSVDTETEQLIQATLAKLMASRTSVVIAHRLSTIQRADQILVFHHGRLRERGTHQELLQMGGIYRGLYELQFQGQG
ncbi:ABC transporter ATP-binding protein [Candidatus Sumerlaeota bacterium]|nr:ABC transporter ATP-binding protein [Candidatus Sumerlaeota bacterium]